MRRRRLLTGSLLAGMGTVLAGPAKDAGASTSPFERLLLEEPTAGPPPSIERLARMLAEAESMFARCRYHDLAGALPDLAAAARTTRAASTGQLAELASNVLAEAYRLGSELAVKLNDDGASWVLADRALTLARRGEPDPLVLARAAHRLAIALRRHDRADAAIRLLVEYAEDPRLLRTTRPDSQGAELYTRMLCSAGYAASGAGDRDRAVDLVVEASALAEHLDDARLRSRIGLYRIGVHNAVGEPGIALSEARKVHPRALGSPERYARYCVDTARAWDQFGDPARALVALRSAERAAPEEVRRPSVRRLVRRLAGGPGVRAPGLHQFARDIGVAT